MRPPIYILKKSDAPSIKVIGSYFSIEERPIEKCDIRPDIVCKITKSQDRNEFNYIKFTDMFLRACKIHLDKYSDPFNQGVYSALFLVAGETLIDNPDKINDAIEVLEKTDFYENVDFDGINIEPNLKGFWDYNQVIGHKEIYIGNMRDVFFRYAIGVHRIRSFVFSNKWIKKYIEKNIGGVYSFVDAHEIREPKENELFFLNTMTQ